MLTAERQTPKSEHQFTLRESSMRARLALFALVLATSVLVAAGCGPPKLKEESSFALPSGGAKAVDLPAISKPQKVNVEFSSTTCEVYVYAIKDFKERDGLDLVPGKAQTLAMKQAKDGSFTVDVPENTATRVVVRGGSEDTQVTLKLTNSN
jgi:hypothetical protein